MRIQIQEKFEKCRYALTVGELYYILLSWRDAMSREIKVGDIVTTNLGQFNNFSNTYLVTSCPEGSRLLTHPLAPECLIIKNESELNTQGANLQDAFEKCLNFASKHKALLGSTNVADLEALIFYFVIKKDLTSKQKSDTLNTCGIIASRLMKGDSNQALLLVKKHHILFDNVTHPSFSYVKEIVSNRYRIENKNQVYNLFSLAGYCLAQLEYSNEQ